MFPVLVIVYARLARREERDVRAQFGEAWGGYVAWTPAFIPRRRLLKAAKSQVSQEVAMDTAVGLVQAYLQWGVEVPGIAAPETPATGRPDRDRTVRDERRGPRRTV